MTSERWQHVLDLFNEALEHDAADRTAFLGAACYDNPELRAEVESLLATYDADPDFLEAPAGRIPQPPSETAIETMEGRRIGPYKILRRLGEGGMGTVYLAVRDDEQYRKHVALKLVKRGMDTEEILRRFRNERQILAALEHPHIARLLDGGMTDDDRPYFVLEYVEDAVPIDVYCDHNRLPIAERLALFRQVCAAVQFAHQNLVVHRDLKPSNILVSKQGTVKLLDFGIAKLLNPNLSPFTVAQTRTEMRLLTPEYASPEQVRGTAITTASDVYQLGVLLYELLTGHRPYRLKSRAADEIARIICEEEPTKPSTVIARTEDVAAQDGSTEAITPQAVSAARASDPSTLRRRLSGDLDTIVLKAMQKEPQRRYQSVEAFAADIGRFLDGQPVAARPDTVGYRMSKFIRRHRAGVGATVVIFVVVLAFGLTMAVQAIRIARQSEQIARERDKAEAVSSFLADLFQGADPTKTPDPSITAREMLDQGVEKVRAELDEQPEVQARLLTVIGGVYRTLGLYDQAQYTLQEAVAVYRRIDAPPDAFGTALLELGNLDYRLDHLDAAEPLLNEALALKTEALGPHHQDVAGILNSLALVAEGQGRVDEAITLLQQVIDIRRQHPADEPDTDLAANLNNLAIMLHDQGRLDEAESMYREALAILEAQWGQRHPYIAFLLNSYAGVHQDRGAYEQAHADFVRALDIAEDLLGDAHPFTAVLYHNRGRLLQAEKRYAEAAQSFEQAADLRRRILPNHADLGESLRALGQVHLDAGAPITAEPSLREALTIHQATYDADDWRLAQTEAQWGRCLSLLGRYAEAQPILRHAHDVLAAQRGPDHQLTHLVATYLAEHEARTTNP